MLHLRITGATWRYIALAALYTHTTGDPLQLIICSTIQFWDCRLCNYNCTICMNVRYALCNTVHKGRLQLITICRCNLLLHRRVRLKSGLSIHTRNLITYLNNFNNNNIYLKGYDREMSLKSQKHGTPNKKFFTSCVSFFLLFQCWSPQGTVL